MLLLSLVIGNDDQILLNGSAFTVLRKVSAFEVLLKGSAIAKKICNMYFIMENIHPFSPQVASLYQRWLGKRLFSDKRL